MSSKSNQIVTFWEDIESQIRCTTFLRKGEVLDNSNQRLVRDALVLTSLGWFDLISSGGYPTVDLKTRWLNAICHTDFYDLVTCFKLSDSLLTRMEFDDYVSFKHLLKQDFPSSGAIIAPLKGLIDEWCNSNTASSFSSLHCCFTFISRLNLHGLDDLIDETMEKFYLDESRISDIIPTQEEVDIISSWFPRSARYDLFENFDPKHGNGSVANCKNSLRDKYSTLGIDPLLHYFNNKIGWSKDNFPRPLLNLERDSKIVFVPKSVTALRTICMESSTLQWYQQGLLSAIDRYICRTPALRKRIDLHDQEKNRDLAWEGSISGQFSTIDLSSASDSVSWQLVKRWFRYSSLREALSCTRSTRSVLPDNTKLVLNKYAPMGSALCFPIECIVFAAMAEASIIEYGDLVSHSRYRVYGDDIVIETKYVPLLTKRLIQNGFLLNLSKTFTTTSGPIFRESCGGEYLDGVDVTPIKLSRNFSGLNFKGKDSSSRIIAAIDLCNRCFNRLPSVRRYVISKLNCLPIAYRVPFSADGETGLFSPNPTNHHISSLKYYHVEYQHLYYKHGGLAVKREPVEQADDDIRLYEWLRSTQHRTHFDYEVDTRVDIRSPQPTTWGRKASML